MPLIVLLFLLLALPAEGARRVAVLDFENQSGGRAKEEYSWIGLNVPETLAGKLSEVPGVQVIERAQWKKLAEELRLQLSDLFDEKKAARLGTHLGAKVLVLGSFAVFEKSVNFNLRFVDVETGRVLGALNRVSPIDGRLFETFTALSLSAVEVLNRRVMGGEVASLPPEERLKVPEEAKEKIERPPVKAFDAYALFGKGNEAYEGHRWDEAIGFFRAALALDPDYPEAWLWLGDALSHHKRWYEAEEAYLHALILLARKGGRLNEMLRGLTLQSLGLLAKDRERYEEAERFFNESVELYRRIGFDFGLAFSLDDLGATLFSRGRVTEAEGLWLESVQIFRKLRLEWGVARRLNDLAALASVKGDRAKAERLYLESLAVNRKRGEQGPVGDALYGLAILADERGRYEEAARLYQESIDVNRSAKNDPGLVATLMHLAYREKGRGSRIIAIIYATEALEVLRRSPGKGSRAVEMMEELLRELGAR